MSLLGPITSLAANPPQLTAYSRFMASKPFGNLRSIMTYFQKSIKG